MSCGKQWCGRSRPGCASASRARCGLTRAAARSTPPIRPTTGRCPSASSAPATPTTWSPPWRRAASSARPCSRAARARAWPGSAATWRSSSISRGTSTDPRDRSGAPASAGAAGRRAGSAARRGGARRPDVRAGPGDAPVVHAWRDDRQQLVRRALGDVGQDRRQHRRARHPDLRRAADARGRDAPGVAGGAHPRRRPRSARSTRDSRGYATATVTWFVRGSRRSRGGCRATTSTSCCRRTASTWRGRWSGPRAPASRSSRRRRGSCPARRAARCCVLGFDDIYLAADAVEEVTAAGPIGLEGIDELLVRHSRKKNLNSKGLDAAAGRAGLAVCRVRRRTPWPRPRRRPPG